MYRVILFVLLFTSEVSFAQNEITWDDLPDVEFEDIYSEEYRWSTFISSFWF